MSGGILRALSAVRRETDSLDELRAAAADAETVATRARLALEEARAAREHAEEAEDVGAHDFAALVRAERLAKRRDVDAEAKRAAAHRAVSAVVSERELGALASGVQAAQGATAEARAAFLAWLQEGDRLIGIWHAAVTAEQKARDDDDRAHGRPVPWRPPYNVVDFLRKELDAAVAARVDANARGTFVAVVQVRQC